MRQLSLNKAWEVTTLSGLSLVNFLEQQLDDKELSVVIDGWIMWATANMPPGNDDIAKEAIATMLNRYTESCIARGGVILEAQKRVIDVLRESQKMKGS